MFSGRRSKGAIAIAVALALLGSSACSQRDDDDDTSSGDEASEGGGGGEESSIPTEDCVSDPTQPIEGDTIRIVSSYPQSGLTAAFSEIARGWGSYFQMVNADGGVEIGGQSYQIEYDDRDDEYNAARTAQNIEELVGAEGDGAFAVFSVVGTANNVAIRDTLNELCVPNVFAATGSPQWGNADYPWMIGSSLAPYTLEGEMFAQVLAEEDPDATVAMLLQDDDFGDAYLEGFERAIEDTDITIVETQRYAPGAGEVAAPMTSLASSGATAFFNGGTLLACPDALTQAANNNWEPITWVSSTCTSKTLMGIAGENADGVYSVTNLKDPLNPEWADDEAIVEYRETVSEYEPEADVENSIVGYGWTQGALFVQALEAAEEPTRLSVMESVRNLDGISGGTLLPGITVTTDGEDDPYMGESLNLMQYSTADGYFSLVGDVIDFEGQALEFTPEDLVSA